MKSPSSGGPQFRAPNAGAARTPAENWTGCAIIGAIVLGIGAIGKCSTQNPATNSTAFVDGNVSNGIAAQAPPPPEPLSVAAANRGMALVRMAVTAEGFPGAMIYSQNCYDALGRRFSWAKLDMCGAADMLAARSIADVDTSTIASEAGYFQSEAAAGRYLAAATAAGEPTDQADQRLSQLQQRAARERVTGRPAPPPADDASNAGEPNDAPNLQLDNDADEGGED